MTSQTADDPLRGRKLAITGAGRGLGAALAIVAADRGARPILMARSQANLDGVAATIATRAGHRPATVLCDLADAASCATAADRILAVHPDLDGIVHNGTMWLAGDLDNVTDEAMVQCVSSAAIGSLVLTRRLLPLLRNRPRADIHTVVSTSGLAHVALHGASVAFRAAKAAQDGFVQGLAEELAGTNVRVTAVYPGNIRDVSPLEAAWEEPRGPRDKLTNREVVEAILFTLTLPANAAVRTLVIESRGSVELG